MAKYTRRIMDPNEEYISGLPPARYYFHVCAFRGVLSLHVVSRDVDMAGYV